MKSITHGPWKWADHHQSPSVRQTVLEFDNDSEPTDNVVLALDPSSSGPLDKDREEAKALIQAAPELRDALVGLVASLSKHHPGGLLPEVATSFIAAQSLLERVAPVRLPGVWEKLENADELYVKTYATPGVWIEAQIRGASISFRAKREFLLGGVLKAAIEVALIRTHAFDRIEIHNAIVELERLLDDELKRKEEAQQHA